MTEDLQVSDSPHVSDISDLQVLSLALAELALRRPGWDPMLTELAERMGVRASFEAFKQTSADLIVPGNFAKGQKNRNFGGDR